MLRLIVSSSSRLLTFRHATRTLVYFLFVISFKTSGRLAPTQAVSAGVKPFGEQAIVPIRLMMLDSMVGWVGEVRGARCEVKTWRSG